METNPRPHQFESVSGGDAEETHRSEPPLPRRLAVPMSRMSELSVSMPPSAPTPRSSVNLEATHARPTLAGPETRPGETHWDDDEDEDDEETRDKPAAASPPPAVEAEASPAPMAEQRTIPASEALLNELRAELAAADAEPYMDVAAEVAENEAVRDEPARSITDVRHAEFNAPSAEAKPLPSPAAPEGGVPPLPQTIQAEHGTPPTVVRRPERSAAHGEHETIADPYAREVLFLPYDAAEDEPANVREGVVPPARKEFANESYQSFNTALGSSETSYSAPGHGQAEEHFLPADAKSFGAAGNGAMPPEGPNGPSFAAESPGEMPPYARNEGSGAEPESPAAPTREQMAALHARLDTLAARNNRLNARVSRAAVFGLGLLGLERHFRRKGDKELRHELVHTQREAAKQHQQLAQEQRRQTDEQYAARVHQERAAAANAAPAPAASFERPGPLPQAHAERAAASRAESYLPVQDLPEHEAEQPYFTLQEGQEVRSSVWHNAVVKNGQVVEGAINYGEGFRGEQRELRHDPLADTMPQAVPTGVGAAFPYLASGVDASHGLSADTEELALPPANSSARPELDHRLTAHAKRPIASNATSPWFWLMLAIVVIGFLTAIAVLH